MATTDPAHDLAASFLDRFRGRLHTISAVLTEVMYFLGRVSKGPQIVAEFATASGLVSHDFSQPPQLGDAARLMAKYSDTPMDYADATLVLLSDRLEITRIATLDRRGFSTFRNRRRGAFQLVLDS